MKSGSAFRATAHVALLSLALTTASAHGQISYFNNFNQYAVPTAINGVGGWVSAGNSEPGRPGPGWYVANNSYLGTSGSATGNYLFRTQPFSAEGQDYATLHLTSPAALNALTVGFNYVLQANESGRVEISGNGTTWVNVSSDLGLTQRFSNDITWTANANLSAKLAAAQVTNDVYLRFTAWNPTATGAWHWFALDNLRVNGVSLGEPAGTTPAQYSTIQDDGQDKLVIVTHGRNPGGGSQPWVDQLRAKVAAQVDVGQWQVSKYEWLSAANTSIFKVNATAEEQGRKLGDDIVQQGRTNVHLIAHSAGASLINEAAKVIKTKNPSAIVQTTFLDAYTGPDDGKRSVYGSYSNWSDSYFAHDADTVDELFSRTEGRLDHAHNVNVTQVDPNKLVITGSPAISTHGWPIDFYKATIPPSSPTDLDGSAEGYGFPLSIEGGGSANWSSHAIGNAPYALGGWVGTYNEILRRLDATINLGALVSESVNAAAHGTTGLSLITHSPAWFAGAVEINDPVNFIGFDVEFTSAVGAEGLLAVYWNNELLGTIDEGFALSGVQHYSFPLPGDFGPGLYSLGFRLDSFSLTSSSVNVDNVATGFVPEPVGMGVIVLAIAWGCRRRGRQYPVCQ